MFLSSSVDGFRWSNFEPPRKLLRDVPEDISVHVGKTVSVLSVKLTGYSLEEYAILRVRS